MSARRAKTVLALSVTKTARRHAHMTLLAIERLLNYELAGGGGELAIAVKALRAIAHGTPTDPTLHSARSRGIAAGALKRMGLL